MKRTFRLLALLVVAMMIAPVVAKAQQMPPVPVDQNVVIGTLPNGLTYYIRHNEYPKGQADFYIAQKVGSMQEEDNQRGLAHFLEHMCFNGTKNFPGNQVVSWLESVGVKFGQNLNAYTSMEETVYNISNVPTERESVQDSCLLILHDWACDLLLEDEEIDKERQVIHQEWRRSMQGQMRILENLLPVMFPDSKYGYRLPIGTMDVVDNFPYDALRDYYKAWYRPDQQGIIVVGDIDVKRIENKIIEMFSHIEMPADAPAREYLPVADNKGTIYAIGKDKEQTQCVMQLMFKTETMPDSLKNSVNYYMHHYMVNMITSMLDARFTEMATDPNCPFAYAGVGYDGMMGITKTKDALTFMGLAKGTDIKPVLEAVYREALRAQRGGFTATEYARARSEYLSRLEKSYNERGKRENGSYVHELVRNFVDGEPIPGIEWEYTMMNMLANQIPVDYINMVYGKLVTADNRIMLVMTPDKEEYNFPTEAELDAVVKSVDAEDIAAYVDNVKSEPLVANLPTPGAVVAEKQDTQWGAIEWTLSNGAKVIVKPTTFKDDEIRFEAIAKGGTSQFDDKMASNLKFMPYVLSQYGLGSYTYSDLQKYMAGKQASVSPSFDDYTRVLNGSATTKDLTTLMELIYMTFTDVQVTESEFASIQNMYSGILRNQEANPQYIFQKNLAKALHKNPRQQAIDVATIMEADRQQILDMIHTMLANAADYTFVFVGNVDPETFRPLVEQYIATLPANAKKAVKKVKLRKDLAMGGGKKTDTFTTKMETPQTWAAIIVFGNMPYTSKDAKLASIAGQILSARLVATVREKEGAVYSIGAQGYMGRIANENVVMQSVFPMKPELKEKVLGMIEGEFNDMTQNITTEELNKVKEFMVKSQTEALEKNGSWMSAIASAQLNGVDAFTGAVEELQSVTEADVADFMKRLMAKGNYRVVILDPEVAE